jgi:ubiquinone/menaquinone biosynthesis C-methylase UbiE
MDFSHRQREPELTDQSDLDPTEHAAALAGLARINRISRSSATAWRAIRRLAIECSTRPLTVLDIASGGDVPLRVARRAKRAGVDVRIEGCDISPTAVSLARRRAQRTGADNVRFFPLNVLREPLPSP